MTDQAKTADQIKADKQACDQALQAMTEQMAENGVSLVVVIDRLMTLGSAYAVRITGKAEAGAMFREIADRIETGLFDHLEPEHLQETMH
tara:strand:- start:41 stop:310 length:270 start_codon:yes stop_codon:yes gene_type:complete